MKRVVDACRRISKNPLGIQLAHAGRKASSQRPWEGGRALPAGESPWRTVSSSTLAFGEGWHVPHELGVDEIRGVVDAFARAAERARRVGQPVRAERRDGLLYGEQLGVPSEIAAADRFVVCLGNDSAAVHHGGADRYLTFRGRRLCFGNRGIHAQHDVGRQGGS